MDNNKKFWQRYAKFYSRFMKSTADSYVEISENVKKYIKREMHVLELACGSGQLSFLLADCAQKWEATDFSENMIIEAKSAQKKQKPMKSLHFSVQDATNLPYGEECFSLQMQNLRNL